MARRCAVLGTRSFTGLARLQADPADADDAQCLGSDRSQLGPADADSCGRCLGSDRFAADADDACQIVHS